MTIHQLAFIRQKKVDGEARQCRKEFYSCVKRMAKNSGQNLAGYAIVVWDMEGTVYSGMWAQRGPVGPGMVPALSHDALSRQVTRDLVEK